MNRFLLLLLILAVATAPWAIAQDAGRALSEDEIVERILDLQRQIDELVAALPPAARERLQRRLAAASPAPAEPPAEAPQSTAVAAAAVAPQEPPLRRRLSRGPHCNFLELLDSNQDGKISAFDRYWRHLYLWSDFNGDRQAQEEEVESAYDLDVREIAVDLDTFVFKKGHIGEMRVAGFVTLDVRGDGLGSADDRVLVVDATKLGRGSGPKISSPDGELLAGFQPFQEGWRIEHDGGQVVLGCP